MGNPVDRDELERQKAAFYAQHGSGGDNLVKVLQGDAAYANRELMGGALGLENAKPENRLLAIRLLQGISPFFASQTAESAIEKSPQTAKAVNALETKPMAPYGPFADKQMGPEGAATLQLAYQILGAALTGGAAGIGKVVQNAPGVFARLPLQVQKVIANAVVGGGLGTTTGLMAATPDKDYLAEAGLTGLTGAGFGAVTGLSPRGEFGPFSREQYITAIRRGQRFKPATSPEKRLPGQRLHPDLLMERKLTPAQQDAWSKAMVDEQTLQQRGVTYDEYMRNWDDVQGYPTKRGVDEAVASVDNWSEWSPSPLPDTVPARPQSLDRQREILLRYSRSQAAEH